MSHDERMPVDRVIVVSPPGRTDPSYLERIHDAASLTVADALLDWEATVDGWCVQYCEQFDDADLVEVLIDTAVYIFDKSPDFERVIGAYGISTPPAGSRDANRIRQFPDVNVGISVNLHEASFPADRGHFLSHAAGGVLDINLFPHRRELNRGWSEEGKTFRRMERFAAENPGTFHFHRPIYDDHTWIPAVLEYGLHSGSEWWINRFSNKDPSV